MGFCSKSKGKESCKWGSESRDVKATQGPVSTQYCFLFGKLLWENTKLKTEFPCPHLITKKEGRKSSKRSWGTKSGKALSAW